MIKELIKLANHLDRIGRAKEADYVDGLIKKEADDDFVMNAEKYFEALGNIESAKSIIWRTERALRGIADKYNNNKDLRVHISSSLDHLSVYFNYPYDLEEGQIDAFTKEMESYGFENNTSTSIKDNRNNSYFSFAMSGKLWVI